MSNPTQTSNRGILWAAAIMVACALVIAGVLFRTATAGATEVAPGSTRGSGEWVITASPAQITVDKTGPNDERVLVTAIHNPETAIELRECRRIHGVFSDWCRPRSPFVAGEYSRFGPISAARGAVPIFTAWDNVAVWVDRVQFIPDVGVWVVVGGFEVPISGGIA